MSDREINAIDFIYKIEYNVTYGAVMITVMSAGVIQVLAPCF